MDPFKKWDTRELIFPSTTSPSSSSSSSASTLSSRRSSLHKWEAEEDKHQPLTTNQNTMSIPSTTASSRSSSMALTTQRPPQFKLRRHQPSDLSAMADIIAACNTRDALSHYLSKNIFKYPTTFPWDNLNLIRSMTTGRGRYTFVAVSWPPAQQVVGCITYSRLGKSETAKEWQSSGCTEWMALVPRKGTDVA